METTENLTPFIATHVGEFIKDELRERNISQRKLSGLTGIQAPIINDIIKGKRGITSEMAILFEKVLDVPASVLMNIQVNYDLDIARISQRVAEQSKALEVWEILKQYICFSFFRKMKCFTKDVRSNVSKIFEIFNVKNIDDFLTIQTTETTKSYCKKSEKLKTDPKSLFSWKYYCFYLSGQNKIGKIYSDSSVDDLIKDLNLIFRENVDTINRTREKLEEYGIRLLIVEKTDKLPIDGFSFWRDENPTIVLTLRKKQIDNFAFTIFHEIGHIKKHLSPNHDGRIDFVDEVSDNGFIDSVELEANDFATESLIPECYWRDFMKKIAGKSQFALRPFILRFSEKVGVNPQICMGRYKFETGNYKIPNWFKSSLE